MNLRSVNIGPRLYISFGLTTALLAVVVALGGNRLASVSHEIDVTMNDRYEKISLLNSVHLAAQDEARALRDALLAADDAALQRDFAVADAQARASAQALSRVAALITIDEGKRRLQQVQQRRAEFQPALDKVAAAARAGQREAAIAMLGGEARQAQQAYFDAIGELVRFQVDLMRSSGKQAQDMAHSASTVMVVLGVVGALLSVLTGWMITRSIVRPIAQAVDTARTVAGGDLSSQFSHHASDEVGQLSRALMDMNDSLVRIVTDVRQGTDTIHHASAEVASGSMDLSGRTERQAGALEETASSMEELTHTVRQNADNARQANQLARSASDVAVRGGAVVEQVVATMAAISNSSQRIVDIIAVIDGIAFQTNILALNAAVEAARAGEQGRGFAVVAGEVRNLAQRSAAAAKEIKSLIDASAEQVDSGARLVDEAGRTMDEVVASVRRVTDIMGDISAASSEQLAGIEHVNEAIGQMDQVTQQNAALVEEAAAAAHAMQEQASQLARAVGVFKLAATHTHLAHVIALPRHHKPRPASEEVFLDRPKRIVAYGGKRRED